MRRDAILCYHNHDVEVGDRPSFVPTVAFRGFGVDTCRIHAAGEGCGWHPDSALPAIQPPLWEGGGRCKGRRGGTLAWGGQGFQHGPGRRSCFNGVEDGEDEGAFPCIPSRLPHFAAPRARSRTGECRDPGRGGWCPPAARSRGISNCRQGAWSRKEWPWPGRGRRAGQPETQKISREDCVPLICRGISSQWPRGKKTCPSSRTSKSSGCSSGAAARPRWCGRRSGQARAPLRTRA